MQSAAVVSAFGLAMGLLMALVPVESLAGPNDLQVQVPMNRSFILSGAGQSCAMTQLAPNRISYPKVNIFWSSSLPLKQVAVAIAFQHPNLKGGQFLCEISRGEFDAAFGVMGAVLAPRAEVQNHNGCPLQCGGIELVDPSKAFVASGALTVFGVEAQGRQQVTRQASVPVELEYVP